MAPQDTWHPKGNPNLTGHSKKQITIEDGLLLKGTHIIVPQTLCKEMIQLLHTGHLGLEKCLNRAKQSMYWPGLYDELKDLITNCTTCLKFSGQRPTSNKQHAGHEIPIHPWSELTSDIFSLWRWQLSTHCGLHISFSHHQETEFHDWKSYCPSHIIHIFQIQMGPNTLVTDKRPCYTSKEFQTLMQSMSVHHLTSSPHYPHRNGHAEKYVRIIKNLFHKAKE